MRTISMYTTNGFSHRTFYPLKGVIFIFFLILSFFQAVVQAESGAFGPIPKDSLLAAGQKDFSDYCSGCHSYTPPPKSAPPAFGLSRQYRLHFGLNGRDSAIAHLVDFLHSPDRSKSICLPQAHERFGTMAPLPIDKNRLKSIAAWIWQIVDSENLGGQSDQQIHKKYGVGNAGKNNKVKSK